MDDWLTRAMFAAAANSPKNHAIVTNLDDSKTPKQLMDELRVEDPDGAALLSEHVLLEDA